MMLVLAAFWDYFFGITMFLTSLFLILLILVQRGRGGGLAGAFGGMGGQSAFGTKAGDLFTRVTMFAATFWILLCIAAIVILNDEPVSRFGSPSAQPSLGAPGDEEAETGQEEATDLPAGSGLSGGAVPKKAAPATPAQPGDAGPSAEDPDE